MEFLKSLGNSLSVASSYSMCIPLLVGIFFFKKIETPILRNFFYFICYASLNTLAMDIMKYHNIPNLGVLNIYCIIEFSFYIFFFFKLIQSAKIRKYVIYSYILATLFAIFNLITLLKEGRFHVQINNNGNMIFSILLTLISGYYLTEKVNNYQSKSIFDPYTIITIGVLLYFSILVILEGFINKILYNVNPTYYYLVHSVLNITCNVIFAAAFVWKPKNLNFKESKTYLT